VSLDNRHSPWLANIVVVRRQWHSAVTGIVAYPGLFEPHFTPGARDRIRRRFSIDISVLGTCWPWSIDGRVDRGQQFVDAIEERGEDFFRVACENDLEGVVAKPKYGPYYANGLRTNCFPGERLSVRHKNHT